MARIKYRTERFYCMFSTAGMIERKMQELLDKNAADGWKLHSWQIPGATASFCVMVFYKDEEAYP